ncbi:MAG: class I SAM-dependent DNA methyltransferase, partial [Pseudomonadota bacterium]|nr:class I SAM-dependent DNA methyltransferase [Pseudomonadota bacterium]
TIIEPLRADWAGVRVAATELIDQEKPNEARAVVEAFHGRLARTTVLDPACGTGNFLYVAMARMKELEGEVLDLLVDLRPAGEEYQYLAELTGHTVTPENFLGIEINPRAAAIAQLVLWIGYLQWHFRVNGKDRAPPEPILRDIRTIENRDALIAYDDRVIDRDATGKPLTRWDGETMKPHPVTGRMVPDDAARTEVYRYVKPRAGKWPKADFIVGNPPFIGGKDVRDKLGDGYFEALFKTTDVPESADFVMHWWDKAALAVRMGGTRRFGFVTTNSITQVFSRRVIAKHLDAKDGLSLRLAIPNHPWVDERDGAAVRIAMTVAAKGQAEGVLMTVIDESGAPERIEFAQAGGRISSDLRTGPDVASALPMKANAKLASRGVPLHGRGFLVKAANVAALNKRTNLELPDIVVPYRNGRDIAQRSRDFWAIDTYGLSEDQLRQSYPAAYQHVLMMVKPERDQNRRGHRSERWWLHGEPVEVMRAGRRGLDRTIVTVETTKHRVFQFLPVSTLPDNMLVCIAIDDAFYLGILSSRIHGTWALASGGRLGMGDDPRYSKTRCFDPFPFPGDVSSLLRSSIADEAENLDALRKRVLAENADLTLTKLYNMMEALRAADRGGPALDAAARDIHDRGLISLLRQHHDAIDRMVAEAYGWGEEWAGGTLTDELLLTRLVALNKQRAVEEEGGFIRWLRPAYQAPDYAAPVNADLDLGDRTIPAPDNVIAWPSTLPEQVGAVRVVLAGASAPMAAQDIARSFKGKRASSVRPVLDALAGLGMARRLKDGRYAA